MAKRKYQKEYSGLEGIIVLLIKAIVALFKVLYYLIYGIIYLLVRGITKLIEYISHKPIIRGKAGEKKVFNMILSIMDDEDEIFSNLVLETANGYTSQIDHLLISKKGIFVFEVKNYTGKIYGNDNMEFWQEYIGNTCYEFYSPVKQNFTHIYEVKRLLQTEDNIHNVVVYVDGNINKVNSKFTYKMNQFKKIYQDDENEVLQQYEIDRYADIINKYQESHKISNKKHIKNIKKKQNDISSNICPRCGAPLIMVNTQNGDRYRCSNDSCEFMMKVK